MIISLGRSRIQIDGILKLALELRKIERQCKLAISNDGTFRPTEEFLAQVAAWLHARGLKNCTLTSAWQLWRIASDRIARLRTEASHLADLAYWYGINPWQLTDNQQATLHANLMRVQAQQRVESGKFDPTDYRGVHDLILLAYDDEELALAYQAEALERYVDAQTRKKELR